MIPRTDIERFTAARACADKAPAGTYEATKDLLRATGEAMDSLIRLARSMGITVCTSDGAYRAEAALWAWLSKDFGQAATAEGFGAAMDTDQAERIIADAERSAAFFRSRVS